MGRPIRDWQGLRPALGGGGGHRSVTVTFDYGGELHTIIARNRKEAFAEASERWGWGWDGEPCVSSPETIYRDLTGWTKHEHGQDFGASDHWARKTERYRRSAIGYNDRG